ncbi:MAG: HNH endonuclease [Flavobacteriaceae bacterium]
MRHGDPTKGRIPTGEAHSFITAIAIPFDADICLEWPFLRNAQGYGQVQWGGRKQLAHRVVCEEVHGGAPSQRHQAAHGCGNSSCVNPHHLRWATPKENDADKLRHGTLQFGERHPNARLSDDDVDTIRRLRGRISQAEIGRMFGIRQSSVSRIQLYQSRTIKDQNDDDVKPQ